MPSDNHNQPPGQAGPRGGEAAAARANEGDALKTFAGGSDFLSLLVHEMRNFVAPVRNAVYLLRTAGLGEAQVRAAADIIERQAAHMGRLLDNLADADRISRGDIALHRAPLELARIIDNAILAAKPLIESRRQRLHIGISNVPLHLHGDAERLVQAFSIVLERAANYTQEEGDIWLDTGEKGGELQVSIRDNGAGIADHSLSSLFDFFSTGNPANQAGRRELGMDLPIAHRLIQMHGGRIDAASTGAGKGSEFKIYLPKLPAGADRDALASAAGGDGGQQRTSAAAVDAALPGISSGERASRDVSRTAGATANTGSAAPRAAHRRRILIVDDNAALRETFADLLQEMGHEVMVASEGLEALDVARQRTPEWVFLDINMPHLNGYEVARQLRAQFSTVTMRLAMMSGDTLTETVVRRAREAGFDHCIDKIGDLEALRALLDGND